MPRAPMRSIRCLRRFMPGLQGAASGSLCHLAKVLAVAARMNSSRAPFGPRKSTVELENELEIANSVSIFLRSRREVRPSHDLAISRHVRAPWEFIINL